MSITAPAGYTLDQFFSGRQLVHARVTPLTPVYSGGFVTGFTKGTPYDLAAAYTVESIEFEGEVEDVEISSANAIMRNYVNVKDNFQVTVGEIKSSNGTTTLMNGWVGVDYFLAEAAYSPDGGATTFLTVQAPCKRRRFTSQGGEGKQVDTLVGVPFGLPMAFVPSGGTLPY